MSNLLNTDGTLNSPDKLGLVNLCLQAIGEIELPDGTLLDQVPSGTDASVANNIVSEVTLEVSNRGWWYNMEDNYEFIPDDDGFIALPGNVLRVDFGNTYNRHVLIKKAGRLYDLTEQSFVFTDVVYGTVVWLVGYEYMPLTVYNYIGLRAARKFQQRIIGAGDLYSFTQVDENDAYMSLQSEQAQVMDYNMLEARVVNRWRNPYWNQFNQ